MQDYIAQILDAFMASPPPPTQWTSPKLFAPLTDRELEVLSLLSQRLSYNECAQKLVVSPNTVKKHSVNIYQKLGVHGRREAISKAKALGILSQ